MKKMKMTFSIYRGSDWYKKIPFKKESSRSYYEKWYEIARDQNIKMHRASIDWYDPKKNAFNRYWVFEKGLWSKRTTPVTPDIVFDYTESQEGSCGHVISKKVKLINSPEFRSLTNSKINQQILFAEYLPKGTLINEMGQLQKLVAKITQKKIVLKEPYGVGGDSVYILETKSFQKFKKVTDLTFPLILQEFIPPSDRLVDGTKVDGASDLRVICLNHKPAFALSRIAKNGSDYTNLTKGASGKKIPLSKIDDQTKTILNEITSKLSPFGNSIYAVDFIYAKSRPILMEINPTPGLNLVYTLSSEKQFERFIKKLLSTSSL